ncbi:preprotein translocase subunit SecG [Salinisphaera sp. SPP-AMP-43]|uniref:preprotein translocase subunit SecG n=1 Tax=Salinisphaera sp. SPP-AMP-43 TaxID=3121288 RepID=UPI003C6E7773
MVYTILVIFEVVVALGLIALILLQHGKGADAGAAFGSGASGTVFGAKGSANFMSRATAGLATLFMLTSLVLAYLVNGGGVGAGSGSVTDQLPQGSSASQSSVVDTQSADSGQNETGSQANQNDSSGSAAAESSKQSDQQNSDNGPKIPD